MIDQLKFVQGAVAKKDFAPVLTHFRIEGGRVTGYNGALALSSPFPLPLTSSPKAIELVKAIQQCTSAISITQLESGDLVVKSGKFKTIVPSTVDPFPQVVPAGHYIASPGELLPPLRELRKFVSEDASRPWSRGILFRNQSAYATNNVMAVQKWLGFGFPIDINVSASTIDELLRIDEEPTHLQLETNETGDEGVAITFHFAGEKWLKANLLNTTWPDVDRVLEGTPDYSAIPDDLWDALDSIKGFTNMLSQVFLSNGMISTTQQPEYGTTIEIPGFVADGVYGHKYLSSLKDTAQGIDWSLYPRPVLFYGNKLRGAIIGMVK